MSFKPDSNPPIPEMVDFRQMPIEDVSIEIRQKFQSKEWKNIPITEQLTSEPKPLQIVPNMPTRNQVMAWPAYYKTVKEGFEDDGRPKGVGELAQAIEGTIQSSPVVKVRAEVKFLLDKAQKTLDANPNTHNLQLVLVDGYRQLNVQKRLFDSYLGYVASNNPHLTALQAADIARKMVSEPSFDPDVLKKSPPPHSTGGSVDIVMVFKDKIDIQSDYWLEGAMVPLGAKFDEMMDPVYKDERSETIFYEKKAAQGDLSQEEKDALEFRRIMYHALKSVGFSNYFTEFWHYDFGNQFDALTASKPEARFGFAGGVAGGQIVENLTAEKDAFASYAATHGEQEAEKVKHHFGLI